MKDVKILSPKEVNKVKAGRRTKDVQNINAYNIGNVIYG